MTMTLISSTTLSTTAATIDFTSIPQTYTDLKIVYSARINADPFGVAVATLSLSINGGGTATTSRALGGNGSSAYSETGSGPVINSSNSTANTFSNGDIYIPNYAGSTNKSMSADSVIENNATASWAAIHAILWSSTSAITSISLVPAAGSFVANSSFALYGILKGSGGATVS